MRKIRIVGGIQRKTPDDYDLLILLLIIVVGVFALVNEEPEVAKEIETPSKVVHEQYHSALGRLQGIENAKEGKRICRSVERQSDCLLRVAKITNSSNVCSEIKKKMTADLCYMHFVNNNDFSVCEDMNDAHIRRSCYSLKRLENLKNSEKISLANGERT